MTIIKSGHAKTRQSAPDDPLGPYTAHLITDTAGLTQFGALIEELSPGAHSSFAHWHAREDEMIMMLTGEVTAIEDGVETVLAPGDAACWRAGDPVAHTLFNHSAAVARYMVIGTRAASDKVTYPHHDRVLHFDRHAKTRRYTTVSGKESGPPVK